MRSVAERLRLKLKCLAKSRGSLRPRAERFKNLRLTRLPSEFVDSQRLDSGVCLQRFFKTPTGYPKKRLEYLCLMSYDISYVL